MVGALAPTVATILIVVVLMLGTLWIAFRCRLRVPDGYAMVVFGMGPAPRVVWKSAWAVPGLAKAELVDLSVKSVRIERQGKEGLICADDRRVDIRLFFRVRVNSTRDDILRVAQSIGSERARQPEILAELFTARFTEALKTVGNTMTFERMYADREALRMRLGEAIGQELNGFALDEVVIDFLRATPRAMLDPSNALDARAIKKLDERTNHVNPGALP